MKRKTCFILVGVGLAAAILWAAFQPVPGYMDAEYYYANALQLVNGQGLQEPFIWNYLANPGSLPSHSFTYWMPLPSLVAAAGMFIFRCTSFLAARSIFILSAAVLPLLVMTLASKFTENRSLTWAAGLLAIFSGFYTVFISQTDSFVLIMLLGSCYTLAAFSGWQVFSSISKSIPYFVGLGFLSGLFHLARADGLLWLGGSIAILFWRAFENREKSARRKKLIRFLIGAAGIMAGYLAATGWWYARNISVWGTLMPPGGLSTIWLTAYDQTFIYPVSGLSLTGWLESGWKAILEVRINSFLQNLKTLLGVQQMVFLIPFTLAGLWRFRKLPFTKFFFLMWLALFTIMTVVFPFAGARGGYLHSGSVFQPLVWALFPAGLEQFIKWGEAKRNWNARIAGKVFAFGFIGIAVVLSAAVYYTRIGIQDESQEWAKSSDQYLRIANYMLEMKVDPSSIIMVNNPPGFYLASERYSIVIPDGDPGTLLKAADRYDASYLVLEENHPAGLDELYNNPQCCQDLEFITSVNGARIFRIHELSQ